VLSIEEAVARIPGWGGAARVSAAPLPGGITNRAYRVEVDADVFVVHIAGPGTALLGVDHHRTYECTAAAGATGVGPEVVHFVPSDGILVTRFIPGRHLEAAEVARPEVLARVVRSLRLCHGGPAFAASFSPFRALESYLAAARRGGAPLPDDIGSLYGDASAIEAAVGPAGDLVRPCHNDLWGPNLIDDGALIRILDWEYAGMGDVYFDLANFAIHHAFADAQDRALLSAYFGASPSSGFARLKLLMIVAELREAMWALAALPVAAGFDCLGYAATHFARCRQSLGDRRFRTWLRGAAPGERIRGGP
jgi:thiamine kinase-like enzyme